MEDYFLQIKKSYYRLCEEKTLKIDALDVIIIAHIEEFQRNGLQCYMADGTFSKMLGVSVSTIQRKISKLSQLGFIHRHTITTSARGQASKQRFLTVNSQAIQSAIDKIERGQKNSPADRIEQSSVTAKAEVKSDGSKCLCDGIKDNLKNNIKDNIKIKDRKLQFSSYGNDELLGDCSNDCEPTTNSFLDDWLGSFDMEVYSAKEKEEVLAANLGDHSLEASYGELVWDDGPNHTYDNPWSANGHLPNEEDLWRDLDRVSSTH